MGEAGILNVNKPRGWTSHDVVAKVRRLAGQKRVGHAGTLDPLATGVLPVLLGRATRLADFIQAGQKTYVACVQLGIATETDDTEGAIVAQSPVPPLSSGDIKAVLARFTGELLQTPPRYSALKVAGRRAYAVARAGGDVALAPRPITIHGLHLIALTPKELTLEVTCSKGTYIRSLARDIAAALGTLGHLAALERTRVGPFTIEDSLRLEEIAARGVETGLLPASTAIPEASVFHADARQTAALLSGQPIPLVCDEITSPPPSSEGGGGQGVVGVDAGLVWVYDPRGRLVCLACADGSLLRPRIVL